MRPEGLAPPSDRKLSIMGISTIDPNAASWAKLKQVIDAGVSAVHNA